MTVLDRVKIAIDAIVIFIVLMFTACASTPTIVTKTVDVPVMVACKVTTPVAPDLHFSPPYPDVFTATRDLLGDRVQMTAYQNELLTALKACR